MTRIFLVPLVLLALTTSARGDDAAKSKEAPVMKRSGPGQATSYRTVTVKAKVVAVDQEKRILTLEGKDGKQEQLVVGPKVKRLNEIAPGDYIKVKYQQGILLQAAAEGAQPSTPSGSVEVQKAGPESAPAAGAHVQLRGTVTVTAVDQKTRTVTLETAKGEVIKVKADPSINLKNVKAGQKLDGVYSESIAVSVEKAKPPEKKM